MNRCLEFMSRQAAHTKLLEKPPGTFLIRFSDGELGAVTIAWCCEKQGIPRGGFRNSRIYGEVLIKISFMTFFATSTSPQITVKFACKIFAKLIFRMTCLRTSVEILRDRNNCLYYNYKQNLWLFFAHIQKLTFEIFLKIYFRRYPNLKDFLAIEFRGFCDKKMKSFLQKIVFVLRYLCHINSHNWFSRSKLCHNSFNIYFLCWSFVCCVFISLWTNFQSGKCHTYF